MAVFTWIPDAPAEADRAPRAASVGFGDGYEQRQRDGLNTLKEVWSLSFSNRPIAEIEAIDDFLKTHEGVDTFQWTPPRSATQSRFVCKSWRKGIGKGAYDSLFATFEEDFGNA